MTALVSPLTSFSTDNINKFSVSNGESSLVDFFENVDRNSVSLIAIRSNSTESSDLKPDDGTSDLIESEGFVVALDQKLTGTDNSQTEAIDGRPTPSDNTSDLDSYENNGESAVCLTKNESTHSQTTIAFDHEGKENCQNTNTEMDSKDVISEEPKQSVRPNESTGIGDERANDCVIDSKYDTVKIRRNNRRQRSQRSSNKKWKRLDVEETGFNLSLIPSLPATEKSSGIDTVPEDSNFASSEHGSGNGPSLVNKENKQTVPDEKDTNKELDDEDFFANLGIDVNDNGDIWEWDGIHFDSLSHLTPFKLGHEESKNPSPSGKKQLVINHSDSRPKSHLALPKGGHEEPKTPSSKCKEQLVKNYSTKLKNRIKNNKYVSNISKSDVDVLFDFSCVSRSKIYIRPDRHRKATKAHKAIKTKHATVSDIFNNPGKKRLYIHHRLFKILNRVNLGFLNETLRCRSRPTPMPKGIDSEWAKGIRLNARKQQPPLSNRVKTSQPQNLNHVLHETNTPGDLEMDLVGFLLSIQHRELTPEDYDMLLRLDESVKAKTVSKNVLDTLKTEMIGEDGLDALCAICMEPYVSGQVRKFLPCEHDFHNDCIDTWLNNSSQNCPLDGLPVIDS